MLLEKVFSSSLISVIGNIAIKLIGIISTIFIARLLTPEDFGIVALAVVIYDVFMSVGQLGAQQYILKQSEIDDNIYNSTFTFRFLNMNSLALILVIIAPLIAQYYQKEIIQKLIYVYALSIFISSLENIYFLKYMRELNYKPVINAALICKIITSFVTILLAFYLQDFWALVYGHLLFCTLKTARTYWLIDSIPKIRFNGLKENWRFSRWFLLEVFIGNIRGKIDVILGGRFFSLKDMGFYEVSRTNGGMLISELNAPLNSIILTALSNNKDNHKSFAQTIILLSFIFSPIFIVGYVFMDLFVYFLLGHKWLEAIPLFQLFLTMAFCGCFIQLINSTLIVNDRIKLLTATNFLITILIVVTMFLAILNESTIIEYALTRVILVPITILIGFTVIRVFLGKSISTSFIAIVSFLSISMLSVFATECMINYLTEINRLWTAIVTALISIPMYGIFALMASQNLQQKYSEFGIVDQLKFICLKKLQRHN